MSEMVHITINKQPLEVPAGTRIIEAAKMLNIDIPHLCYHPDQTIKAHCRMCMVEVVGSRKLTAACSTVVWEGMEVITDSKKVYDAQTGVLDLILSDHKTNCLSCARNGSCELQALCRRFNRLHPELPDISSDEPLRIDNPSIVRDPAKCVKCGRCVKVCAEVQGCAALTYSGRSAGFKVTTAFDLPMDQTDCVLCGQCSLVCPVGAIVETDYTNEVTAAIQDSSKHVIVQVAPSVRVGLGDEFGMEAGAVVTGKMVTALRMLGFDKVFDTNFSADLTIMEEGSELLKRIREGGKLPMITSCSPGWVTYLEKHHPELIDHLSTAKSPQAMFGAVAKTYYAQKMGWDPHDVVSVSVMPCTAKKYEASRPELGRDGYQDVDYVLTTRELAKLIRYVGLDLSVLPESEFDSPLGTGSGAGAIFGATGGVMEAALRTAYFSHLYRIVHRQYTGRTQKVLLRALGEQIDLLNIIHVLRLKTYFPQTEPETYLRVLFPFHYRLNPDFTRALCAAPGVDDVFALLRDSPYRDCFDGVAVGAVEEYYQRAICRFNKRQLAAVPPSIYTAVAYLELKELELSVLINVIESVKYGVPYRAELADLVGQ